MTGLKGKRGENNQPYRRKGTDEVKFDSPRYKQEIKNIKKAERTLDWNNVKRLKAWTLNKKGVTHVDYRHRFISLKVFFLSFYFHKGS